jgi:predicted enzyme related to lactoylglutathione lyase
VTGFALRAVQLPVMDLDAVLPFYTDILGWSLRFRDGARYAALDAGGVTVALAAPAEQLVEGRPSLNVKVADLERALQTLLDAGARVICAPSDGPHESRAAVLDAAGNVVVLYQPRGA